LAVDYADILPSVWQNYAESFKEQFIKVHNEQGPAEVVKTLELEPSARLAEVAAGFLGIEWPDTPPPMWPKDHPLSAYHSEAVYTE
jgi:hypothetical protein